MKTKHLNKKTIAIVSILVLLLILAGCLLGCGGDDKNKNDDKDKAETSQEVENKEEAKADEQTKKEEVKKEEKKNEEKSTASSNGDTTSSDNSTSTSASGNSSGNSGSSANTFSGSSTGSGSGSGSSVGSGSSKPAHTHNWKPVYKEVDRGSYQTVGVQETYVTCNHCHEEITYIIDEHVKAHAMNEGIAVGYTSKKRWVYKEEWVPNIVQEVTGYTCSCGATK